MRVCLVAILCICFSAISAIADDWDPPSLGVKKLQQLDIPGYTGKIANNIQAFVVTINDVRDASFFVPDARKLNVACQSVENYNVFCDTKKPTECKRLPQTTCWRDEASEVMIDEKTCGQLQLKDKNGKDLTFPLYTLHDWRQLIRPKAPFVMVNANWYNVLGTPSQNYPHNSPCTDIFGYSVNKHDLISAFENPDNQANEKLDVLVISSLDANGPYRRFQLHIMSATQFATYPRGTIQYAVGGFILAENGKVRDDAAIAKAAKPDQPGGRSAIGLTEDGKTMHIVVVQSGQGRAGATAQQLALYMTKVLKDRSVLNFDNGGSSQIVFDDGGHNTGESFPGDKDMRNQIVSRPIPNFLAVVAHLENANGGGPCYFGGLDKECKALAYHAKPAHPKTELKR